MYYSLEDVKKAARGLSGRKGLQEVKDLLIRFGVRQCPELRPEQYSEFIDACNGGETEAHRVARMGIASATEALAVMQGIYRRQKDQNAPDDGDELYLFCKAFEVFFPTQAGQS